MWVGPPLHKRPPKPKRIKPKRAPREKLTVAQFAERYEEEVERQLRRYCDAFGMWKSCADKTCRRARACLGAEGPCLKRAVMSVPLPAQRDAARTIAGAMAKNMGGPERLVRLSAPLDFFQGRVDGDAIDRMKRLLKAGKIVQRGNNVHSFRLWFVDSRSRDARDADSARDREGAALRSLGLDVG